MLAFGDVISYKEYMNMKYLEAAVGDAFIADWFRVVRSLQIKVRKIVDTAFHTAFPSTVGQGVEKHEMPIYKRRPAVRLAFF